MKNGKIINIHGYSLIRINKKYVYEHRYIMEQSLGRPLKRNESIHHIDGNKLNNLINNLQILTKTEHNSRSTIKHRLKPFSFI